MSRTDLLPALFVDGLALTATERAVCAAVLICGSESSGVVMARMADVAPRAGVTLRGLQKMAERGAAPGVMVWSIGVVGLIVGAIASTNAVHPQHEQSSPPTNGVHANGVHPPRTEFMRTEFVQGERGSCGTGGATGAGVTDHPLQGDKPPSGGRSHARDDSTDGDSPTLSGADAPPPTHLTGGQGQESKRPIPGDVINRWAALMDAGGAPLRPALVEHLSQAWRDFDGDVIRLALAELEDGKIERHGRCPKPMWLVERCQRIAAEREAGADAAPRRRTDSTAPRTYPGGEGKHTKPREGEVRAFTMDEVPDFGIRAIDAIDSVMARPLTDAERFEVAKVLWRENRFTIFAVPRFVSGNWRSLHAALAAILPEARRVAEQEAEEAENWDEWYKDGKTPQQRETAERIANMPKPEDVAHKWAAMLACTLPPPPEYVTRNMPKDGEP